MNNTTTEHYGEGTVIETMEMKTFMATDFSKKPSSIGIFTVFVTDKDPLGNMVAFRYCGDADKLKEIKCGLKTRCEWMTKKEFLATDLKKNPQFRRIRLTDCTGRIIDGHPIIDEFIGNANILFRMQNKLKSLEKRTRYI